MPQAFMLINSEMGVEDELLKELKRMENVREAYSVCGVYDIVVKVEADTMEELKEVATSKTRRLDKVRSTLTMIVMEST